VKGRVISVRSITAADEAAWRALAERAIEPNPLYEPDCLIPAAQHQTFGAEIGLAVAEEDGRWYACVPTRNVKRWHKLPYPMVTSQVRRMIYQGTPLVDRDRSVEAVRALLSALVAAPGSRVFALQEITEGDVAAVVLQAATELRLPCYDFESFERGFLVRQPDHTRGATLKSETRRNLQKKRRRLTRELGTEPEFVDRSADPAAIDDYIALEAAGYKLGIGVAMTTVPGETDFFRDMCARFAAAGRLHVLALQAGAAPLAMDIWIRGREGEFMIKTSYDQRYSAFSPGLMLHIDAMMFFHEHSDADWLETCTYNGNELFLRIYPDRRRITTLFIVLDPTWKNRVDQLVLRSFMSLRPLHTKLYERRHGEAAHGASGVEAPGVPSDR
jgi:CelD/BcsL family acetyltransferase involved in cellulose biosynthesis